MTQRIRFSPFLVGGFFAGTAFLAGARHAGAVDVPFAAQPPITSSAGLVLSAAGADIDGDGDPDVVAGGSGLLAWYQNTAGDGSAWSTRTIGTAAGTTLGVSAADLDGDGDLDVLSSWDSAPDVVFWHENAAGDGSVWIPHTITTALNNPRSVVPADMDGDGDLDLLSASGGALDVIWYENAAGDGSAWLPHTVSAVDGPGSATAADVDGDGDLDVVSIHDTYQAPGTRLFWFENTAGNGTAWTQHTIVTGLPNPLAVHAADVDGDGDVDVLAASLYGGITWHENLLGDGSAWTTHTIGPGTRSVDAADLDGDGDLDVVAGSDGLLAWHENTAGDGSTWTTHTLSTPPTSNSALATDLDGDGDEDVVATQSDGIVTWFRNETIHSSACFDPPASVSTAVPGGISANAADVDGDGDLDVVAGSGYDDQITWQENVLGDGSAWALHHIATPAFLTAVVTADVDGDGDVDVVAGSIVMDKVAWYENLAGDGSAWSTHVVTTFALIPRVVFAADVDGDGDTDLLSASNYDSKIAWYENTAGDGTSWTTHTISLAAAFTYGLSVADVDGDGDVDVLSVTVYDNKLAWYENTAGDGSAWTTHTITTAGSQPTSVFAADVDRDGDMDLVSTRLGGIVWHENTAGDGSAWTLHTVATALPYAQDVSGADVDGDGDVDVIASSFTLGDPNVAWAENTSGEGSTWAFHGIAAEGAPRGSLAADMDGDGRIDAVSCGDDANGVAWHRNAGGQFSLAATDTAPPTANNSALVPMLRVDAAHLGRAGDHDLELASLGLLFEEEASDPLTTGEANALVESLRIYRDANGNGSFDPGTDVLVTSVPDLVLTGGVQTVTFADGDASVQVGQGASRVYFVVAELTANASQQTPHQLRVTHLGLGPSASTAEDRDYDIPLRPACPADVASGIVQAVVPLPLVTATKTVTGPFHEGSPIAYAIVLTNAGPGTAPDTSADELQDTAPSTLTVTGADDGGAPGTVTVAGNDVRWNGAIPTASAVTITVQATINAGTLGTVITNQGTATYDSDGNGTGDSTIPTDDPGLPGAADPTSFTVTVVPEGDLVHGMERVLDLAASGSADVDLFGFRQEAHASYEVVVDGITGDIGSGASGPALDLVAADGTTVVQSSTAAGVGFSRSLRFENASSGPVQDRLVRVLSQGCTTSCTVEDRYRVRAWETTLGLARLNNSASQLTVLVLQNPTQATVTGNVWLRDSAGALAASVPFTIPPRGSFVLNTSAVAAGVSGSLTISHDAPYGALAGKAVAVEPATGFTFDTPLVPRPR